MIGLECYDRPGSSPSSMLLSLEPLKALGIPNALCDLISNLIDFTDGGVPVAESQKAVTDYEMT